VRADLHIARLRVRHSLRERLGRSLLGMELAGRSSSIRTCCAFRVPRTRPPPGIANHAPRISVAAALVVTRRPDHL
jgi:hypothetical protein